MRVVMQSEILGDGAMVTPITVLVLSVEERDTLVKYNFVATEPVPDKPNFSVVVMDDEAEFDLLIRTMEQLFGGITFEQGDR